MTSKKTVMKNTVILYFRMIVTLLVSLYTSRVTLELLGIDDFGIYGVIGGIVSLFAFLSRTLTVSFNRFLCINIANDDLLAIRRIISASLSIQLIIILIVLLVTETVGIWFLNNYLVIAPEKLGIAHIVLQLSVLTFSVSIFNSAYNSIIISYEKMTVFAYLCIFEVLAKLGGVFLLYLIDSSRLVFYTATILAVQIIVLGFYYIYTIRNFPDLKPLRNGSTKYIKEMLSFTGYGFIGSFGFVAKNQGLNFLLNIFGGTVLNAARSISFQVYTAVYNFVGNFQTAYSPYILKKQAVESKNACNHDVSIFTQLSFGIMMVLMTPICFSTEWILHLWLGDNVPEYTPFFTRIILMIGLCEALTAPIQNIIYGSGRILWLQISAFIINLSVILFSLILLKQGYSPNIVYICDLISNICLFYIRIYIAGKVTDLRPGKYLLNDIIPISIILLCVISVYILFVNYLHANLSGILLAEGILLLYIYIKTPKALKDKILSKLLRR